MSAEPGTIAENSKGAPDRGLTSTDPPKKQSWWDKLTPAEKAEHTRKAQEGREKAAAKKAAKAAGKASGDSAPRPKSSRAPRVDSKAADLQVIRELFGGLLAAPAMLGAIRGDQFLVDHFTNRAPELAEAIVAEAERNAAFRAYLVRLASAARGASLLGAVAMYVLPPLMHFGVVPGADVLGVPVLVNRPGPAVPRPGQAPPFVAPERGPAEVPVNRGAEAEGAITPEQEAWMQTLTPEAQDELAAELSDTEFAPPLPMEPV